MTHRLSSTPRRPRASARESSAHLKRAAIDLWQPEEGNPATPHLLACPACRKLLGGRLVLRALLREPLPRLAGPLPELRDWEQFHEFLLGGQENEPLSEANFLHLFRLVEQCETCAETFFYVHELHKHTRAAFDQLLGASFESSDPVQPLAPSRASMFAIRRVGAIQVEFRSQGLQLKFIPAEPYKGALHFARGTHSLPLPTVSASVEIRPVLHSRRKTEPVERVAAQKILGQVAPSGEDLRLHLGAIDIRIHVTKQNKSLKLAVRSRHSATGSAIAGLGISASLDGSRKSSAIGSVSGLTDGSGAAEVLLPLPRKSAAAQERRAAGRWSLQIREAGAATAFALEVQIQSPEYPPRSHEVPRAGGATTDA